VIPGTAGRIALRRGKGTRIPPPSSPSDPELQQFYQDWFMPLVRRAHWHHSLSADDARDVVQEAFVLAIQKLDVRQNPKVWLKRVVDNLALNLVRKNRRRLRLLRRFGEQPARDRPFSEDQT
jgi:DNA-directed RNA polymerase specialized sigma24 family protein